MKPEFFPSNKGIPVKLSFAGDLCLQGIDSRNYYIDPAIKKIFLESDLSLANLESPLTHSSCKHPGQPCHLKGAPIPGKILDLFDLFSIANNHILDYSVQGLRDTCAFLSEQGKMWFGAGLNRSQAYIPLCIQRKNLRLAFIGCTRWYNAGRKKTGTAPMHQGRLNRIIRDLKKKDYFVVVFPHWNYEHVEYPSPIDQKRAHGWIDAGADLIVGAHPHCIQGIETHRRRFIFHSLGNFIFNLFDLALPEFSQTFIPTVTVQPDHTCSFVIHPVFSTPEGIFLLDGPEKKLFLEKLHRISRVLMDKKLHQHLFYNNSSAILKDTMGALNAASEKNPFLFSILKRLHRIQRQDIYIKMHSIRH